MVIKPTSRRETGVIHGGTVNLKLFAYLYLPQVNKSAALLTMSCSRLSIIIIICPGVSQTKNNSSSHRCCIIDTSQTYVMPSFLR